MVSRQTSDEIFNKLKTNPDNARCFECNSPDASFTSLSLAIFLCRPCAEAHRQLGVNISFVRSLEHDSWSIKQLKILSAGGNEVFRAYLESCSITPDIPVDSRYRLVAVEYYRDKVIAAGRGLPFTKPPPTLEEGLRPLEVALPEEEVPGDPVPPKKSRFGMFVSSAVCMTKAAANKLSETAQQVKATPTFQAVSSKANSALSSIGEGLQKGADWTVEKSKVVADHPKVQASVLSVKSALSRVQENETFQRVSATAESVLKSVETRIKAKVAEFKQPESP
jgi:hypothetical protein